jgi:hypothetical protein
MLDVLKFDSINDLIDKIINNVVDEDKWKIIFGIKE